jgi:hypothetical protein
MRAAENDTPSNLARVERRSCSLRLSRARSFRSRQPRESYPYWIFGKFFPGLAELARQLGRALKTSTNSVPASTVERV